MRKNIIKLFSVCGAGDVLCVHIDQRKKEESRIDEGRRKYWNREGWSGV